MRKFCQFWKVYTEENEALIARAFPRLQDEFYLDHAGAGLYSEEQLQSIFYELSSNIFGNPHTTNIYSKMTKDTIDIIRARILEHFCTTSEEYTVIFTSGATASLKLVAECFDYAHRKPYQEEGVFAYLEDNHTSVLGMREYARNIKPISHERAVENLSVQHPKQKDLNDTNSLFVYPAQCNFSGMKYPLTWIENVKNGSLNRMLSTKSKNWFVLLDAASYVPTNILNLSKYKPDFVALSFYKMFGYPTGLGALLVKNSSRDVLVKKYYGGGTVYLAISSENVHIPRKNFHERFEDGTVPFLSILSLRHGFETITRLRLTYYMISQHTFSLAQYLYRNLRVLHHRNGKPVVRVYSDTNYDCPENQGGIVTFNILRANGSYVGYSEVLHAGNLFNIYLRTGCFCNPGACQRHLGLTKEDVYKHFEAGHVCGDQHDLVSGYPTGCVRISFGYMSRQQDADRLLEMVKECFVEKPLIIKIPSNWYNWQKPIQPTSVLKPAATRRETTPRSEKKGILKDIYVYPVKSCAPFRVSSHWEVVSTGLRFDRQFMVVNSANTCLTQKMHKRLCLIKPFIDIENNILTLSSEGFNSVTIPLDENNNNNSSMVQICQSKVCNKSIKGWDCGEKVSRWIDNVLNTQGCRLLRQVDSDVINENSGEKTNLSLVNQAQFLLINTSSVGCLREKMMTVNFTEDLNTTNRRFRPNFVVDFDEAFVENTVNYFLIGTENSSSKFEVSGKCTRCQMICIDQETGKVSKEPLITLSKEKQGDFTFGVYLKKVDLGNIHSVLHVGCLVQAICN